ncbi:DUF4307 domain-containing protein [Nocardioides gansuensis]|uniref:DUF4307 domain-containing protein n=1 Tax=Nocardioides gansuensis TaxID=2138300 RepID=A0A2T8F7K6_9ACTN|nr:DUF4307 domain-containing protein [Nocardioides gansuensis]PVG81685.1 DUF4307 domain-containing protein [Nocardioides gansuensis]
MTPTDLSDRYGAPPAWRRPLLVVVGVLLALVFGAWLAWTAWFHSTPDVSSELVGYDVVSDHEATAVLEVDVADGVEATCRVRALAADHTVVGDLAFTPTDGRNEVVVRTERRATAVEKVGCTTPDQARPR